MANATVDKLLSVARNEIGYLEKRTNAYLNDKTKNAGSGNYTKYGAWYEGGWANGLAWCAIFVCWCENQVGMLDGKVVCRKASCDDFIPFFKKQGRWHERRKENYTPKPGDLILFSHRPPDANHIGIVSHVKGGRVYTIEGNTSAGSTLVPNGGGVAAKNYSLNYKNIYGYCNPNYPGSTKAVSTTDEEEEYMPKKVKMVVNGSVSEMTAIEHKDENYVRIKELSKAGLDVSYDGSRRMPVINIKPVKKLKMIVDNKPIEIPNFEMNGSNYGGIRALMESIGYTVTWDAATHTVICKK